MIINTINIGNLKKNDHVVSVMTGNNFFVESVINSGIILRTVDGRMITYNSEHFDKIGFIKVKHQ